MFTQILLFIIGLFGLVMGLIEGDYLWAILGALMMLLTIDLFYTLLFNKSIWDRRPSEQANKE